MLFRIFFNTDIVFFIFLYQRWIYKVDKTRVNEFGFSAEMEDNIKETVNGETSNEQEKPIQLAIKDKKRD